MKRHAGIDWRYFVNRAREGAVDELVVLQDALHEHFGPQFAAAVERVHRMQTLGGASDPEVVGQMVARVTVENLETWDRPERYGLEAWRPFLIYSQPGLMKYHVCDVDTAIVYGAGSKYDVAADNVRLLEASRPFEGVMQGVVCQPCEGSPT